MPRMRHSCSKSIFPRRSWSTSIQMVPRVLTSKPGVRNEEEEKEEDGGGGEGRVGEAHTFIHTRTRTQRRSKIREERRQLGGAKRAI